MLCLSGFELYSRWVPLFNVHFTNIAKMLARDIPVGEVDRLENLKIYRHMQIQFPKCKFGLTCFVNYNLHVKVS